MLSRPVASWSRPSARAAKKREHAAVNLDAAARRRQHTGHDREQRRLARSVGAHEPEPRAVRHFEIDAAEGVDRHGWGRLSANGLDHATLDAVVEDREQLVLGANIAEADLGHHATQYGSRERARVNTASPRATLITVTIAVPT